MRMTSFQASSVSSSDQRWAQPISSGSSTAGSAQVREVQLPVLSFALVARGDDMAKDVLMKRDKVTRAIYRKPREALRGRSQAEHLEDGGIGLCARGDFAKGVGVEVVKHTAGLNAAWKMGRCYRGFAWLDA